MEKNLKIYVLDGEEYYFNGKRWTDSNGMVVPSSILGRLNLFLINDDEFLSASDSELLQYASNVKEGENYSLAIRAMEILIDRANVDIVRSVLPRLTSCYRKMGRAEDAIGLAEGYLANPALNVATEALYTSLGAAYCDIEEYEKARKYANRAYAMSSGNASPELGSLYGRMNKYDEVNTTSSKKERIRKEDTVVQQEPVKPMVLQEVRRVEFSGSREREAMNRIWKAIPAAERSKYYGDFETVCTSLKSGQLTVLEDKI